MHLHLKISLLILMLCPCCASAEFESLWKKCETQMQEQSFPRQCLVLGVLTQKKKYQPVHNKIQNYCLENINRWKMLDIADEQILKSYYPKCFYVWQGLESPNRTKNSLNQRDKKNLVRFLYLKL